MLIYFSNSSHTKIEKDYFSQLVNRIENNGFEVFWPERDSAAVKSEDRSRLIKNWRKQKMDKIKNAQVFVLTLDGKSVGEDEVIDLGAFIAGKENGKLDKLVVGLNNEIHRGEIESRVSEAVLAAVDCFPKNDYDLIDCLKSYYITYDKTYGKLKK